MRHLYPYLFYLIRVALLVAGPIGLSAQTCPDGSLQGQTMNRHTVTVASGVTDVNVTFPQYDPANGMVTCVNFCVTIKGVLNMQMENKNVNGSTVANIIYNRFDEITGPGLSTPVSNAITNFNPYGPITLTTKDGVPNSGTDYFERIDDTIMRTTICRNISDAATIADFYGSGNLVYNYNIAAFIGFNGGGNLENMSFFTEAVAEFSLSYCTCPSVVLPVNVYAFEVTKLFENKAKLDWSGYDDATGNYRYVPEVSRDGRNFTGLGSVPKNQGGNAPYSINYKAAGGSGIYYFRIRQVYANGYTRFSNIRQVQLENPGGPKFSVYPNPSTGIVGIKFDNIRGGQYSLKIFNSLGQAVVSKDLSGNSSSYNQVAKLKTGVYWIRLTDKDTNESGVSQIIIK